MAEAATGASNTALVIIPTSNGPVSIVSLVEQEGEDGLSAVGLNKTAGPAAGISTRYNAFVRRSTGIIHRLFTPSRAPLYRLDISGEVEGDSWQLAVLITHALHAQGRLDVDAAPGSALVWATGLVSAVGFAVGGVAHVSLKLRLSQELFEKALQHGRRIEIFIPVENQSDIDPDIARWLADHNLRPRPVALADEVFAALGLPSIPRASSKPWGAKPSWPGNPYRGLEAYREEHRPVFFGRSRAREEALEQLRIAAGHGRPFLLIHGQSGVGKSSLVQAGLAGDVIERAHEGGRIRSAVIMPSEGGANPVAALCRGLRSLLQDTAPAPGVPDNAEEATRLLGRFASQAQAGAEKQRGLLVIDQLEELFDPAVGQTQAVSFGNVLGQIVDTQMVWVIATMRSDALGLLDRVPALTRLVSDERTYRLKPPSRFELSEIVAAPAALAGKSFPDRSVPEAFADQAARSPDSLPLLQSVLYRFFEQADAQGQLTAEGLKRIGGFEGAVGQWADQARETILASGVSGTDLDRVLVSLIRIDPETRRPLARPVAYSTDSDDGRIIRQLVNARLVSSHDGATGPQARLAHEVLATHWSHLKTLVERLGAAIVLRDDLEERTQTWLTANKEQSELIRSPARLDAATSFIADAIVPFNPDVTDYVTASIKAQREEQERAILRQRLALAAAIVFAIIASVAIWQSKQAYDATAVAIEAQKSEADAKKAAEQRAVEAVEATKRERTARAQAEVAAKRAEDATAMAIKSAEDAKRSENRAKLAAESEAIARRDADANAKRASEAANRERRARIEADNQREIIEEQNAKLAPANAQNLLDQGYIEEALLLLSDAAATFKNKALPATITKTAYTAAKVAADRTIISVGEPAILVKNTFGNRYLLLGKSTNTIYKFSGKEAPVPLQKTSLSLADVYQAHYIAERGSIVLIQHDKSVIELQLSGEWRRFEPFVPTDIDIQTVLAVTREGLVAMSYVINSGKDSETSYVSVLDLDTGLHAETKAYESRLASQGSRSFILQYYRRAIEKPYNGGIGSDKEFTPIEIIRTKNKIRLQPARLSRSEFENLRVSACIRADVTVPKQMRQPILDAYDDGPSSSSEINCWLMSDQLIISYLNWNSAGLYTNVRHVNKDGTTKDLSDLQFSVEDPDLFTVHQEKEDGQIMIGRASNNVITLDVVELDNSSEQTEVVVSSSQQHVVRNQPDHILFLADGTLASFQASTGEFTLFAPPQSLDDNSPPGAELVSDDFILDALNPGTCVGNGGSTTTTVTLPDGHIVDFDNESERNTIDLKSESGIVSIALPDDNYVCIQFSRDFTKLLTVGQDAVKVYDFQGARGSGSLIGFEEGRIEGTFNSAIFDQENGVVTTNGSREVVRWQKDNGSQYSSEILYRAGMSVIYAEPGTDDYLIVVTKEDIGAGVRAILVSQSEDLDLVTLKYEYKFVNAGFDKDGHVYFGRSNWEGRISVPTASGILSLLTRNIPSHCAPQRADDFSSSPCWPYRGTIQKEKVGDSHW